MKKFLLLISFLFCFSVFAEDGISKSADNDDTNFFNFTIEPLFGTRIGRFGEQVYSKNSKTGEQYKLSELFYNFSPALYTGLDSDFKFRNFHISLGFKYFVPMKSGLMRDSDWQQDSLYNTGNTIIKTNYSEHENYIRYGLNFEASVKYDFHPLTWLTLSPAISFSYENFIFSAMNGIAWYGNDKNNNPENSGYYSYDDINHRHVIPFNGEVIQLRRKDYYAWIGFETSCKSSSRWNILCGIYVAPFIYTHGEDDHYYGPRYHIDTTASIFYAAKTKLYIQYNFTDKISLKLSNTLLFTGNMQGNELKSSSKSGPYQNQRTVIGATSFYSDIQLSALFIF